MSQFHLKVSDLYDLLVGGSYKLLVDGIDTSIAIAKRWDGSEWVLIYDVKVGNTKFNRINYYNGTSWINASLK